MLIKFEVLAQFLLGTYIYIFMVYR